MSQGITRWWHLWRNGVRPWVADVIHSRWDIPQCRHKCQRNTAKPSQATTFKQPVTQWNLPKLPYSNNQWHSETFPSYHIQTTSDTVKPSQATIFKQPVTQWNLPKLPHSNNQWYSETFQSYHIQTTTNTVKLSQATIFIHHWCKKVSQATIFKQWFSETYPSYHIQTTIDTS